MTAAPSLDHARFLHDHLARASPDLLRDLLSAFVDALMGAEADAICGAEWRGRDRRFEQASAQHGSPLQTDPMDWPLAIETPLGPLAVALTCGLQPAGAPDVDCTLESGAVVGTWRDVAGATVDLLLTRYDGSLVVPAGYAVPECWGMEWRFHAPGGWTPPMALSALLPEGTGATYDADEDVIVAEAWTDDWRLCLGGADEVWFARQVQSAGLAPSWGRVFSEVGPPGVGGLGPWQTERGLTWFLPALEEGESATVWVALAWCPAGVPEADNAANFAVQVSAAFIRAAAGVGVSRRRGP